MPQNEIAIPEGKDLIPADSQTLVDVALEFCTSVTEIKIGTEDEYKNACELVKKTTTHKTALEIERKHILKPLKDATDFVNDFFRKPQTALKNIDDKLRKSVGTYMQELEDKRREEQRRADEAAQKERDRLAAEAREREARAKELAENGQAKRAETQMEKAVAVKQIAETVEAPKIESVAPKVEGVHTRDKYSGIVRDKAQFVAYAVTSEQSAMLLDCIDINTGKLDRIIQAAKGKINLPGIAIKEEKIPVIR